MHVEPLPGLFVVTIRVDDVLERLRCGLVFREHVAGEVDLFDGRLDMGRLEHHALILVELVRLQLPLLL